MSTTRQTELTLHLPLKRKWFEMIRSGVKKEEYRELSEYWKKRLLEEDDEYRRTVNIQVRPYTRITFTLGYPRLDDPGRIMTFECDEITVGRGNPDWGAPDYDVFIIKIGERIK